MLVLRINCTAAGPACQRPARRVGELSGGTFQIDVHTVMADEEHGVALTRTTARRGEKRLIAQSVNVFHVRDGKITEVWQASEDQPAINKFWS